MQGPDGSIAMSQRALHCSQKNGEHWAFLRSSLDENGDGTVYYPVHIAQMNATSLRQLTAVSPTDAEVVCLCVRHLPKVLENN